MDFDSIAQYLGEILTSKNLILATAESCTGGWVAEVVTSIPGSSQWFDCAFVTYSNESKQKMLDIDLNRIYTEGAVSEVVACLMAENAICLSRAQVSLAITGIAGPHGGTKEKPVGTVCFAWAGKNFKTRSKCMFFKGDRKSIRMQSVDFALKELLNILEGD